MGNVGTGSFGDPHNSPPGDDKYWRLIHGELARLASVKWRFMCISGEKTLETIWKELTEEVEEELK